MDGFGLFLLSIGIVCAPVPVTIRHPRGASINKSFLLTSLPTPFYSKFLEQSGQYCRIHIDKDRQVLAPPFIPFMAVSSSSLTRVTYLRSGYVRSCGRELDSLKQVFGM